MISSNDLKNGMTIIFNDVVHEVVEFERNKHANRRAFVRVKLRNLSNNAVIEHKFLGKEPLEQAILDKKELQYLYRDKNSFCFMDPDTSEQISVEREKVEPFIEYLKEGTSFTFILFKDTLVSIEFPDYIELQVTHALAGVKGDTVQGSTKPVVLETGKEIQAPLFINQGDVIRVDTRTGKYIERVQR